MAARTDPIPILPVAMLSAAGLAYEVLLTRLFALIQWHHFAYMVISLALLGYGASGTFLTLTRADRQEGFPTAFAVYATLFGVSAIGCFALAQGLQFNPLELAWDPRQPLRLLAVYGLLAVPFFFAACGIGLALIRFAQAMPRVYGADLLGAALGGVGVMGLLFVQPAERALAVAAGVGILAGAVVAGGRRRYWPAGVMVVLAMMVVLAGRYLALQPSAYKDISQALEVQGASVTAQRTGPLGLVQVVQSPAVPIRIAPGLSLMSEAIPPAQFGLFIDGNGPSPVIPRGANLAYLDQMPTALPYALLREPEVLVLGAGGGSEVLQALSLGARRVDAVELDPNVIGVLREDMAGRVVPALTDPRVRTHMAEARGFVESTAQRYDLIQLALLDSFAAAGGGLHGLSESYLYTVEAMEAMLARLRPEGLLAVTRWLKLPPRDGLKLFGTAAVALERQGVSDPGARLAMIRSWSTTTLLVKHGPLTTQDIAAIKRFADRLQYDLVHYPGMGEAEANRRNRLESPAFYRGAQALLGPDRRRFLEESRYVLTPATDDKPYFFQFFRWSGFVAALAARDRGGLGLVEWGYPILVLTLVQAIILSVVLILLPLLVRRGIVREGRWRFFALAYFGAIGLGFMALEIALIQKLVLYLHHPVYAVAFVLVTLLLGAGSGSLWAMGLRQRPARWAALSAGGVAAAAIAIGLGIDGLFQDLLGQQTWVRVVAAGMVVVPLGLLLGMPFPLGLTLLARGAPELTPWAWGINGCASVIGAVSAGLLAVHLGFAGVLWVAAGLYAVAAALMVSRGAGAGPGAMAAR
jgi:spermidine synthase